MFLARQLSMEAALHGCANINADIIYNVRGQLDEGDGNAMTMAAHAADTTQGPISM
jgi:hypothetical protein